MASINWQFNPYVLPLFFTAFLTAGLGLYVWTRKNYSAARLLAVLLLTMTIWTTAYAFELMGSDLSTKLFWARLKYLGITSLPIAWLIYTLRKAGKDKKLLATPWLLGLLCFIPLITLIAFWTPQLNSLIWGSVRLTQTGTFMLLEVTHGWGFWISCVYAYLLLLIGSFILLQDTFKQHRIYQFHSLAILVAVIIPWIGNILYLANLNPFPGLDLTPFGFSICGPILTWSLLDQNIIQTIPIARSTVFESLSSAVIVLDINDRILDLNLSAAHLFKKPLHKLFGKPFKAILDQWPDLKKNFPLESHAQTEHIVPREIAGQKNSFILKVSPLKDQTGQQTGRLILLTDVSDHWHTLQDVERLRLALETSGDAVFMTNTDGLINYINPAFTNMYGYSPEEVIGKVTPRILKSDQMRAGDYELFWQTLLSKQVVKGHLVNKTCSGKLINIESTSNPILDENGEISGFLAIQRDVSKEKDAAQQLQFRLNELTLLHKVAVAGVETKDVDALLHPATRLVGETLHPDNFGILLLDRNKGELYLHSSYRISSQSIDLRIPLGRGITGRVAYDGQTRRIADVTLEPDFISGIEGTLSELCVPLKIGQQVLGVINVESSKLNAFSEYDENLLVTFASQLATAIERARLFEQVQRLAVTDELTGLHNRRYLYAEARDEFERTRRFNHPLSTIILDIDHFKHINDNYGHPIGDEILRMVAQRLLKNVRQVDLIGRYGGDEFAILLPETNLDSALILADRLCRSVEELPFKTRAGSMVLTISLGVASLEETTIDFDALLKAADDALLTSKQAGRNRISVSRSNKR